MQPDKTARSIFESAARVSIKVILHLRLNSKDEGPPRLRRPPHLSGHGASSKTRRQASLNIWWAASHGVRRRAQTPTISSAFRGSAAAPCSAEDACSLPRRRAPTTKQHDAPDCGRAALRKQQRSSGGPRGSHVGVGRVATPVLLRSAPPPPHGKTNFKCHQAGARPPCSSGRNAIATHYLSE